MIFFSTLRFAFFSIKIYYFLPYIAFPKKYYALYFPDFTFWQLIKLLICNSLRTFGSPFTFSFLLLFLSCFFTFFHFWGKLLFYIYSYKTFYLSFAILFYILFYILSQFFLFLYEYYLLLIFIFIT